MPLIGQAFVIMWHDIESAADGEYNLWHTREHMPERIALPGFLRSRRGVNRSLDRQHYFTLYEGERLETFVSEGYLKSLNYPTQWTTRVAPNFRNFLRMSCELAYSRGHGVGGGLATFRCALGHGIDEAAALAALQPVLAAIAERRCVSGVHVGVARPNFAGGDTREIELRPVMRETAFDLVVIVEGIGLAELAEDEGEIAGMISAAGLSDVLPQTYDMAYMLEREREAA